jgi:hypothetical protein
MGARSPSQRSFGLVDQLPHDVGYGQDFFDSSRSLSCPNQRFSTRSAAEPFDNFRPKAFSVPARLIPFSAPFIQKCSAQGSPDGAVSDRTEPWNDVVENLGLHRVFGMRLDDRLLPIIVNRRFFGREETGPYVDIKAAAMPRPS